MRLVSPGAWDRPVKIPGSITRSLRLTAAPGQENDHSQNRVGGREVEWHRGPGAPGEKESAGRGGGVDHAEEAQRGRGKKRERAAREAAVDQIGGRGAPDEGRDHETAPEESQSAERFACFSRGLRDARRQDRPRLEGRDEREGRQDSDRGGGGMS